MIFSLPAPHHLDTASREIASSRTENRWDGRGVPRHGTHRGCSYVSLSPRFNLTRYSHGLAGEIAASERYISLTAFTTVYGIGPVTARRLYDLGLRTIADLKLYYSVESEADLDDAEDVDAAETRSSTSASRWRNGAREREDQSAAIKVGLALHEDLMVKIPRDEVDEIARLVYAELCAIEPGCAYTIVGG